VIRQIPQNDAKRERALLKSRNEIAAKEKLEAEIERLQEELEHQRQAKEGLQHVQC
jgi:hypothetical protein